MAVAAGAFDSPASSLQPISIMMIIDAGECIQCCGVQSHLDLIYRAILINVMTDSNILCKYERLENAKLPFGLTLASQCHVLSKF